MARDVSVLSHTNHQPVRGSEAAIALFHCNRAVGIAIALFHCNRPVSLQSRCWYCNRPVSLQSRCFIAIALFHCNRPVSLQSRCWYSCIFPTSNGHAKLKGSGDKASPCFKAFGTVSRNTDLFSLLVLELGKAMRSQDFSNAWR
jgi:hypothetical protein